jgi:hypothetical protein
MELARSGCPWLERHTAAAFAAEAVVRLLPSPLGFAAPEVRHFFRPRAGLSLAFGSAAGAGAPTEEDRLLGAALAKIAHRGVPAPCSVEVERHALREATACGVLDFQEDNKTGEFRFSCRPRLPGLERLLRVCLL